MRDHMNGYLLPHERTVRKQNSRDEAVLPSAMNVITAFETAKQVPHFDMALTSLKKLSAILGIFPWVFWPSNVD